MKKKAKKSTKPEVKRAPEKKKKASSSLKDRVKERYEERDSYGTSGSKVISTDGYEDVKFYKPEEGKNTIDIIPYKVTTKNHPKGLEIGEEDYVLDIWVHRGIGAAEGDVLCLKSTYGKPCPICENIKELKHAGDVDDEVIKNLYPKHRSVYNVIDADDPDSGIQLFNVSQRLFEKELLEEAFVGDDEFVDFVSLEEGKSIKFRASEEKFGKATYMKFKSFSFVDREEAFDEDIMDDVYPLDAMLIVPTYEEVEKMYLGTEDSEADDNDEEDEDDDASDAAVSRRVRRAVEKDDEDDEEKEEESPKKKKKKAGKESPSGKTKCPAGGKFGKDADKYDECEDCDYLEACADESE